jgi:hypothetical protein
MENDVEKALDNFVDAPEIQEEKKKDENAKKVVLDEREGLIERVDKVFITKDGKQLLREWY